MQNDISKNLEKWNKISNYSRWMFGTYQKYIKRRVLDVGAGVGTMTQYYLDNCELVTAVDIFQEQVDEMAKRFQSKHNFESRVFDILKDDITPLLDKKFDTIICNNVLEHLEDDELAILRMKEIVGEGGNIIILVPAIKSLYCYMDRNVSHYRRYDKGELSKIANSCGLKVVENRYFNFWGILPYYLKGKYSQDKEGSYSTGLDNVNSRIYNLASAVLEPIEKVFKPPVGISEIIILRK